jgi:hypothetical protein
VTLWLVTVGMQSPPRARRIDDRPCPCVQAWSIDGVAKHQHWIEESDCNPIRGMTEPQIRAAANRANRR